VEWCFKYDSYQDVRQNLFRYSIVPLNVSGFLFFHGILPNNFQDWLLSLIKWVTSSQIFHYLSGFAVLTFLAFFLTEIIQVHDRWYDRYIIKWRFRYATDFILPRLVHPLASKLNYRFHKVAEENIGDFQERLFYPFVRDRDNRIAKNLLVRFYEKVTVYWLTQVNEILIVTLLPIGLCFAWFTPVDPQYQNRLWKTIIALIVAFVLNRIWAKSSRENVRLATEEEIKAIHSQYLVDLETALKEVCRDYGITYA
jgi:hypothetical protein